MDRSPVRHIVPDQPAFRPGPAGTQEVTVRAFLTAVCKGDVKKELPAIAARLRRNPDDPEALYAMAIFWSRWGHPDRAMLSVERALAAGLPFERFLAGPRDLLAPLYRTEAFRKLAAERDVAVVHGPLLGDVTARSARLWVRTARTGILGVECSEEGKLQPTLTASAIPDREAGFTAVLTLTGLQPATVYTYRLLLDGHPVRLPQKLTFRTAPPPGAPARFAVGFGASAGYAPERERIWDTIAKQNLQAFLMLGDNVHADETRYAPTQLYCRFRRQSRPEYRRLTARTPLYAIWNKRDLGTADPVGTLDADDAPWKATVLSIFRQNTANPSYGTGGRPGVWHRFSIGQVDFFLLDGRFHRRDGGKGEEPTMLGAVQRAWLLRELRASRAAFKVIAGPVPWTGGGESNPGDTWGRYPQEREEIFGFIQRDRIPGVILLSGGRAGSEARRIKRAGAYPLYAFSSAALTIPSKQPAVPGALFARPGAGSFGVLAFDTTAGDPTVTYSIVTADGKVAHTLALRREQLSFR
jgi:alkaline phosphatase D